MTSLLGEFWVMDLSKCKVSEWADQCLCWTGISAEDAAEDAARFWSEPMDDGEIRTARVMVADDEEGTNAQILRIEVEAEVSYSSHVESVEPVTVVPRQE